MGACPAGVDPDEVTAQYGQGSPVWSGFNQGLQWLINDVGAGRHLSNAKDLSDEMDRVRPVVRQGCNA